MAKWDKASIMQSGACTGQAQQKNHINLQETQVKLDKMSNK